MLMNFKVPEIKAECQMSGSAGESAEVLLHLFMLCLCVPALCSLQVLM